MKFQDVFGHTMVELAEKNPKIVGITAAMPSGTSMCILKEAYPRRVFDVGISEEHAVTFAGGLAKEGLRPFVAIYSSFLQRAYDQMIHDVALMRLPVTFCIDRAGLVGEDGATHHGAFDLAYLTSIPGMTVAAPRDEATLRNLLYTAQAADCGPMAIRYPRGCGFSADWRTPMRALEIGRGEQLAHGTDLAIISTGTIAREVSEAIALLAAQGISAAHFDMTFVKPLDTAMLRDIARSGMPVLTVEDGTIEGGLGTAVAAWMADEGYHPAMRRLGIPDRFVAQGSVAQLKKLCDIDAASIAQAAAGLAKIQSPVKSTAICE